MPSGTIRAWSKRTGTIDLQDDDELGRGGEGVVYSVDGYPDLVAKIYLTKPTPNKVRKIETMIARPPRIKHIPTGHICVAWPVDILTNSSREVIGFLMMRANRTNDLIDYYIPARRRSENLNVDYRDLCLVARGLANSISVLHQQDYVIGDINQDNAYITRGNRVTLIDSDSFQVRDRQRRVVYPCVVGKAEYLPPELRGKNLRKVHRMPEQDNFALAVLIYQLLMEGMHPFTTGAAYTGAGERPNRDEGTLKGYFVMNSPVWKPNRDVVILWERLHKDIQGLFMRCFVQGHRTPRTRPIGGGMDGHLGSDDEGTRELRSRTLVFWERQSLPTVPSRWAFCLFAAATTPKHWVVVAPRHGATSAPKREYEQLLST